MATLVCFHAHPGDEAISTGGTMAMAAANGHRVVLVVATDGRHGEVPDDLKPGETLVDRRKDETLASARILGVSAVHWLGYDDSGMNGWAQNDHATSFHQAPLEEAAERLATILRAEQADVLTCYDWHGNYGHPDHVKVHHVGHRAAELARTPYVYEATMNRDEIVRMMAQAKDLGLDVDGPDDTDDGNPFGSSEDEITTMIDVSAYIDRKRESIACHRSQITDTSFFLTMAPEVFLQAFGREWFIRKGSPGGIHEHALAGLD